MSKLRDSKKKKKRKLEKSRVSYNSRVNRDDMRCFALFAWVLLNTIKTCAYLFYAIASRAITFNNVFPFNRYFLFVPPRAGSDKMVMKEQNSAYTNKVVGAEKLITKFHNMNWLKNPVIPDSNDFEEKMGRNKINKRKSAGKGQTISQNNSSSNNAPGPSNNAPGLSNTIWNGKKSTTENLFPNANTASAQAVNEDEDLRRAMEESRKMYEEANRMTANLTIQDNEDTDNKSDDDDYWNKKHSNLPDPEPEKAARPSDTNNNSSAKHVSVAQIQEASAGRSITARKSNYVGESVKKMQEATRSNDNKIESMGRGKMNMGQFDTANGRKRHPTIGRSSRTDESHFRMNQQKETSQDAVYYSNSGDFTESENYDSRRQENRQHNNRESTNSYSQSRGYSHNTGRGTERRDKYHYVKEQPQVKEESKERASRNDDEISEKISTSFENSKARGSNREVLDKNLYEKEAPKLRILTNDKNPEACQNSTKQSDQEVLRLRGFHSRLNRPPPDNEDIVPLTPKPEVTASTSAADNFAGTLETLRSSTTMHNPPPGFAQAMPCYHQNEPPCGNLAPNHSSQNLYDKLAVHDPLLHRLLIQKQKNDYLSGTNRQVYVGYENYQPEEEQGAMQPVSISEEQNYAYTQDVGYPINYPYDMENQYCFSTSHPEIMSSIPKTVYYAHSQPATIVENSLSSNVDYADNRPNVQMANEAGTLRGTARSYRTPVSNVPSQTSLVFRPQFQSRYCDNPYENLVSPEYSLLMNQFQAAPRLLMLPGRPPNVPSAAAMNQQHILAPPGQSILRPYRPQSALNNPRLQGQTPSMKQFDESTNIGNQRLDHLHGTNESPFNRDPHQPQMRSQQIRNMERARERLPQQTR